jgi:D-alanyl-D-alanine carboxypeptidase
MKNLVLRTSLVLSFLAAACNEPSPDASSPIPVSSRDETTPTCVAQGHTMDGALAHVPVDATYDAVLEMTTSDCGATFHATGPSGLDAHRLFRIGSMTKTYVAVVALGLAGEGKIALDGRLDAYLPDAPSAVGSITIRQLLQHTSGIFNYTDTEAFWTAYGENPMRRWAPSELVALALAQPPYSAPGAEWHYSNTNFVLLGMMLERVGGAPIATLIRERILVPNGLAETFLDGAEPVVGQLAPGFDEHGQNIGATYDPSLAWAAGAMVASPPDASRFVELVGQGALLPPAMQAEMTTGGVDTPEHGLQYGLGVFLLGPELSAGQGPAIGHGGDIMGFHSGGFYFPEKKMTLFGVVDSDRGTGNDVLAGAIEALAGSPSTPHAPTQRRRVSSVVQSLRSF